MGRWLPKEERDKRDRKVVELYQQGLTYSVIAQRMGMTSNNCIYQILRKHGIATNRGRGRR